MTTSDVQTRKTYGRSRPVAGSQVRSSAVDTFETWTTPRVSAMPAMASESELALEPMMATACPSSTAFNAAWRPSTK
jgi:hypothetical protein